MFGKSLELRESSVDYKIREEGIIPRVARELFDRLDKVKSEQNSTIEISL